MSKLTDQQKAANKAAQKVRDQSFSARKREYNAALNAARDAAELSTFAERRSVADAELKREINNLNQALREIDQEIQELEKKKIRVREQYGMSVGRKKEERDLARQAFRDHVGALEQQVYGQYPDMVGVWSVAGWKIPDDVKAQMEAAREQA